MEYKVNAFQIGWYIVPKDKEYTDRGYECAAWYKTILVKAGQYPVMARAYYYNERDKVITNKIHDTSISIKLNGVVTADDFAGRFCGSIIGKPNFDKYKGQEDCIYIRPYCHATANDILNGVSSIELLDGFEAKEIPYIYDGKSGKTYGIFKV